MGIKLKLIIDFFTISLIPILLIIILSIYYPGKLFSIEGASIIIGIIFFILVISIFISKSLVGKIEDTTKTMDEISKGNFDTISDAKLTNANDEIGNLVRSINKMQLYVKDLVKSNEEKTKKLEEGKVSMQAHIKKLNSAIEDLKALDKMKTTFLASTSHELKTPITPLLIQLEMLQRGNFGKLNKKQAESVTILHRNIKRLNRLITEILDVGRAMGGKMKLQKKLTNLNVLIGSAIETEKTKATSKNITITVTKSPLPLIDLDTDKITEVLINLIDNSIKFAEQNGNIWIEARQVENYVVIGIRDDGAGIKDENIDKLFKPFTQLHNVQTRKVGGTGLGLSICKMILNLHDGDIWVKSEGLGQGTTFYFSLPLKLSRSIVNEQVARPEIFEDSKAQK